MWTSKPSRLSHRLLHVSTNRAASSRWSVTAPRPWSTHAVAAPGCSRANASPASPTPRKTRSSDRRDALPPRNADDRTRAAFVAGENFKANVITDGRLVTGQNPASAKGTAEQVVRNRTHPVNTQASYRKADHEQPRLQVIEIVGSSETGSDAAANRDRTRGQNDPRHAGPWSKKCARTSKTRRSSTGR